MEHIVQFGVTIDDDAIRKHIEQNAMAATVKMFTDEMKAHLPQTWGGSVDWNRVAYNAVEKFLDKNKDEIMDMAANRLVEKTTRTKAWRERRDKALEG